MAGEIVAPAPGAPPPAAPGANANPAAPGAPPNAPNTAEQSWQEKAGFVKRVAEDKTERWVRPLKVDGQDIDFDPSDPKSWDDLNLGVAAKRRMSEAAREKAAAKDEVDRIINGLATNLQSDPIGTYEQMLRGAGLDPEKVWAFREQERARKAALTPEARNAEQARQEAAAAKAELERFRKQQEQAQLSQQTRAIIEQTDRGMTEAMQKNGLDPQDPYLRVAVVMRAKAMLRKNPNGPQDLGVVAAYVASTHRTALPKTLDGVSDDQLLDFLGADRLARIHRLAAAKAVGNKNPPVPAPPTSRERRAPAGADQANLKPQTPAEKIREAQKKNGGRRFHGGI